MKRCEIAGGGFTRLADMDPHSIKKGMQSCRDTADVGRVIAVNKKEGHSLCGLRPGRKSCRSTIQILEWRRRPSLRKRIRCVTATPRDGQD